MWRLVSRCGSLSLLCLGVMETGGWAQTQGVRVVGAEDGMIRYSDHVPYWRWWSAGGWEGEDGAV